MEVEVSLSDLVLGIPTHICGHLERLLLLPFLWLGRNQFLGIHNASYHTELYGYLLTIYLFHRAYCCGACNLYRHSYGKSAVVLWLGTEGAEQCSQGRSLCLLCSLLGFLASAVLLSFLAFLNLAHLALYQLVVLAACCLVQLFAELVQFAAYLACAFLLCLSLANFSYGVLHHGIRVLDYLFGLLSCPLDYFLALVLQFLYFAFIPLDGLFHLLLLRMYGLALTLPIALVANDVQKVLVGIHVVLAHKVGGICDNFLGDTYLARYLYGKGTAWIAYLQLEQSLHLVSVVEHGPVYHTVVCIGKML